MMEFSPLHISIALLWLLVIGLTISLFAMARQIGILYERIAPMGALMMDDGPKIGELCPAFTLTTIDGNEISIGESKPKANLIFFLAPGCPVCKKLIPVLRSAQKVEKKWLDITLASDGNLRIQQQYYEKEKLNDFPYVLSKELGLRFKISKLPYALLISKEGIIKSKGLINSREQLESLFVAKELDTESIQKYLETASEQ